MESDKDVSSGRVSRFLILASLLVVLAVLNINTITAVTVSSSVAINNIAPTVDSVNCLGVTNAITPQAKSNYTVNCSIQVTDLNGYQDLRDDGWFRLYFYQMGTAWSETVYQDSSYFNLTCFNSSMTGTTALFNCSFTVAYWADATTWNVLANVSDGTAQNYSNKSFIINRMFGMDQDGSIVFGNMVLGANGTQWDANKASIPWRLNNTGNYPINLLAAGGGDLNCFIGGVAMPGQGSFPLGNIHYNQSNTSVFVGSCVLTTDTGGTCNYLNQTFNLGDCEGSCPTPNSSVVGWGVAIPTSAVAGTCNQTITITNKEYGT